MKIAFPFPWNALFSQGMKGFNWGKALLRLEGNFDFPPRGKNLPLAISLASQKNRNRRKIASVFKSQSSNRKFYCRDRRKIARKSQKKSHKNRCVFGGCRIKIAAFPRFQNRSVFGTLRPFLCLKRCYGHPMGVWIGGVRNCHPIFGPPPWGPFGGHPGQYYEVGAS